MTRAKVIRIGFQIDELIHLTNSKGAFHLESIFLRSPRKELNFCTSGKVINTCGDMPQVNKDLLTVGYGQFDFGTQKGGVVAFWSIKNPGYPLATIACKSDVTAIDFSTSSPTLLAG